MSSTKVRLVGRALLVTAVLGLTACSNEVGTGSAADGAAASGTDTPTTSPLACADGGPCAINDQGPGGGYVFYDAGSPQPWGRYLEVAPYWWHGARYYTFECDMPLPDTTGLNRIGYGLTAFRLLAAACPGAAAVVPVMLYSPPQGDQLVKDWYIPNQKELSLLLKADGWLDHDDNDYWTSTTADDNKIVIGAWWPGMTNDPAGAEYTTLEGQFDALVRPIHAFGPRSTDTPDSTLPASTGPTATDAPPSSGSPTTAPRVTTPMGSPQISMTPAAHDYGTVDTPSSSPFTFTITNIGGGTLTLTTFGFVNDDQYFHTMTNSCQGAALVAGASCTVVVQMYTNRDASAPPGHHADTFTVSSNAGTATAAVSYDTTDFNTA